MKFQFLDHACFLLEVEGKQLLFEDQELNLVNIGEQIELHI